ncbi:MAG: HNH endonuclease [Halobacteria archaeon]|nr:HNH endonuclease [Halobacteria archaeon]
MAGTDISKEDCSEMRSLYYDKRYSMREIAEVFDCKKETVRTHLRYECNHEEEHPSDIVQLKEKLEKRDESIETSEHETSTTVRNTPSEFRPLVLRLYYNQCLITSVDDPRLLEVSHVLSWSDYPEYRHEVENVMVLNKIHHAAFDSGIFTLSQDYRLHVSPDFETESTFLRRTLLEKEGDKIELPEEVRIKPEFLERHNQDLDWWN